MAPPRQLPELNEDATAEILLRLPPDEPAWLLRAALVCRPWLRLLTDPAFLRRYRAFHGAPPLLGLHHRRRRVRSKQPPSDLRLRIALEFGGSGHCTDLVSDCG
ncbi:hypothetical protein ACP70R_028610 [Stipagrostis hirtigluma subsp. patula]